MPKNLKPHARSRRYDTGRGTECLVGAALPHRAHVKNYIRSTSYPHLALLSVLPPRLSKLVSVLRAVEMRRVAGDFNP